MTIDEIKTMSAAEIAKQLQEYQKWRRGEPPYEYGGYNMPFRPHELGAIIDRAVEILSKARGENKRQPKKHTSEEPSCSQCRHFIGFSELITDYDTGEAIETVRCNVQVFATPDFAKSCPFRRLKEERNA